MFEPFPRGGIRIDRTAKAVVELITVLHIVIETALKGLAGIMPKHLSEWILGHPGVILLGKGVIFIWKWTSKLSFARTVLSP